MPCWSSDPGIVPSSSPSAIARPTGMTARPVAASPHYKSAMTVRSTTSSSDWLRNGSVHPGFTVVNIRYRSCRVLSHIAPPQVLVWSGIALRRGLLARALRSWPEKDGFKQTDGSAAPRRGQTARPTGTEGRRTVRWTLQSPSRRRPQGRRRCVALVRSGQRERVPEASPTPSGRTRPAFPQTRTSRGEKP
jgi:hypothetical protein